MRDEDMKIVYIAHPIGGDVANNLAKIKEIIKKLNLERNDIVPFAHYWVDCHALDDSIPEQRQRGIENNVVLLKAGFISEIWLYGGKISSGMKEEILLAKELGIPYYAKDAVTEFALRKFEQQLIEDNLPQSFNCLYGIQEYVKAHTMGDELLTRLTSLHKVLLGEVTKLAPKK